MNIIDVNTEIGPYKANTMFNRIINTAKTLFHNVHMTIENEFTEETQEAQDVEMEELEVNDIGAHTTNDTNVNTFNGTPVRFPMKPTYIYVRASTTPQHTEAQKHACIMYARANGLNVEGVIIEKASAYKSKQVKLERFLTGTRNYNIIIYAVDRFSRNIETCDKLVNIVIRNFHTLLCVKTMVDIDSAIGKLNFRNAVSIAQYESELIGERVRNDVKYRRDMGFHVGSAPYGYKIVNKKLNIDIVESAVIKFIIQNRTSKNTISRVNRMLMVLLKSIGKENDYAQVQITYEDEERIYRVYEQTDVFQVTYSAIADILNDFNIDKRGKKWTKAMVARIVKQQFEGKGIQHMRLE